MSVEQHGAADNSASKKWVPLESNPETLTKFVQGLTGSTDQSFHDVFTLDDNPDYIPKPVYAMLLVFPVTDRYVETRTETDRGKEPYNPGPEEDAVWFKQNIPNACGTIGILHALSNGDVVKSLNPQSPLRSLLEKVASQDPETRAKTVEESQELEDLHTHIAQLGDTEAPDASEEVDMHYICFVRGRHSRNIYEMDGRRAVGPIKRSVLPDDEDMGGPTVRSIIKEFVEAEKDNPTFALHFGLLALAPNMD